MTRTVLTLVAPLGRDATSARTPSTPSATARLCWTYLVGLMTANGAGSPVSRPLRSSVTCCLWSLMVALGFAGSALVTGAGVALGLEAQATSSPAQAAARPT